VFALAGLSRLLRALAVRGILWDDPGFGVVTRGTGPVAVMLSLGLPV